MPFSKRHKPNPVPGRGCGRCSRNKEGVIVRNRQVEQLVRLTQACLTRYWQLDCEYVLQYLDRDVIWIGSAAHQFVEGREATAADLRRSMEEIQPCHLLHQAFLVAQNAGNACTIVGRYLTTTDDEVFHTQIGVRNRLDGGRRRVKKYLWSFVRTVPAGAGQAVTCSTSGMGLRLK